MNASGQRICLNMIVKNEAPVIRRCLTSVLPIIDHWVIVDTGSEDGTQQIIREFLADLPGELHERPWVNFAHNRSEALELAREQGDYIFVIDADEILEIEPGTELPQLILDSYNVQVRYGNTKYLRRQLVRNALPWRYEGVLHEYITCEQARTEQFLPGLCTVPHHDGARALDPLTYKKDAALLEKAVQEDPTNARYVFYLAQSHRDAGDFEAALLVYKQRVDLGGWREEVWYSLYQIAQLKERLRHPWPEAMDAYLTAWQYQPHRAGPLYRIAMHYQAKSEYHTSHLFLSKAMQLPTPGPEGLFVEHTLYAYQLALDHAVASYYVGDQEAAVAGNSNLLRSGQLPAFAVDQVIRNRRFSLDLHYKQNRREQPHTSSLYVFVPITDNPSLELDDCLDSLLSQQSDPFQVVILSLTPPSRNASHLVRTSRWYNRAARMYGKAFAITSRQQIAPAKLPCCFSLRRGWIPLAPLHPCAHSLATQTVRLPTDSSALHPAAWARQSHPPAATHSQSSPPTSSAVGQFLFAPAFSNLSRRVQRSTPHRYSALQATHKSASLMRSGR